MESLQLFVRQGRSRSPPRSTWKLKRGNKINETKSWKNEENTGSKTHSVRLVSKRGKDSSSSEKKKREGASDRKFRIDTKAHVKIRLTYWDTKGREVSLRAAGKWEFVEIFQRRILWRRNELTKIIIEQQRSTNKMSVVAISRVP